MFIYSNTQLDEVESGEVDDELIVIGLEVAEDAGTVSTASLDNSANFPAPRSVLNGGSTHVVLMPDSGLQHLYSHQDLTVSHDPSEVARCLLDSNYLAPVVFGRGADAELRQRVFSFLDLDDRGIAGGHDYRADLREIAGIESDPEVQETVTETETERIKNEYKYTELKTLASDAGIDNANKKKDELAEWLAESDADV